MLPIPFQLVYTHMLFTAVVTVGLQQTSYSVTESEGIVDVCAILTGQTEREVFVSLFTEADSALS